MKIRTLLLLATTLTVSMMKAQDYEIVSVVPDYLIPDQENEIVVTLNKTIEENDSIFVIVKGYEDGVFIDEYYPYPWDLSQSDSVVTAVINIPDLTTELEGILHLEIVNTNEWTSQNIVYDKSLLIGGNIYSLIPEMCMVSVDSNNQNMIIWEPFEEEYLDSVLIYKETSVVDEFEKIGSRSVNETSIFIDEESIQAQNSNRYKIACIDTAGNLSKFSAPHKTMHLTMNVGINGINLIWEKYEGFDYSTFYIYRGSSKEEMVKIAEIPSNLFTFTDLNPSLFHLYYQVVIENPTPCDITQEKSAQDIFSSTKSNFVEYSVVSNQLPEDSEYEINIYPNPVGDFLSINIENLPVEEFDIVIHDLTGRSVQNYTSLSNGSKIDLSNLKAGVYLITVRSNGINQNKIISKE